MSSCLEADLQLYDAEAISMRSHGGKLTLSRAIRIAEDVGARLDEDASAYVY